MMHHHMRQCGAAITAGSIASTLHPCVLLPHPQKANPIAQTQHRGKTQSTLTASTRLSVRKREGKRAKSCCARDRQNDLIDRCRFVVLPQGF